MVSKIDQIKEALDAGKSTRAIATEFKVSLRDIAKIRKDLGIDFGALERRKATLNEEIEALEEEIRQKESWNKTLAQSISVQKNKLAEGLDREMSGKKNELALLDYDLDRRRAQVRAVPNYVIQDVEAPSNWARIDAWLDRLTPEQLDWLAERACDKAIAVHYRNARLALERQLR
jgi:septal ring factor EnvC (AmiA/AmiB activator)